MPTLIKPYTEDWEPAVKAFNDRLRQSGSVFIFPERHVPVSLPKVEGNPVFHEYFLATDAGDVRGGYILKHQPFLVSGTEMSLAQYRLPVSEGQVDKRYTSLGAQLYLDAVRKQPRMYTVGIGSYDEAFAKLLISAGWQTSTVPFYFRVLRPAAFLRNIVYLRSSPTRRFLLDAMAFSGAGAVAIHGYQAWKTRRRPRAAAAYTYTTEPAFGPWADEIWQAARDGYSLIAVRDSQVLNLLYSASEPAWQRLKVMIAGRVVGWCVVVSVAMRGHNYFGNMRVGTLVDCLALAGSESEVACAAMDHLSAAGADLVVSNQAHYRWRKALESAGCYEGPSNYIFAASKQVAALLAPFDEKKESLHMTRGDGSGPENLLSAKH